MQLNRTLALSPGGEVFARVETSHRMVMVSNAGKVSSLSLGERARVRANPFSTESIRLNPAMQLESELVNHGCTQRGAAATPPSPSGAYHYAQISRISSPNPEGIPPPSPRVARHELPWESGETRIQPQRGCASGRQSGRNPVGVETAVERRSQGRRGTPTLGLGPESL